MQLAAQVSTSGTRHLRSGETSPFTSPFPLCKSRFKCNKKSNSASRITQPIWWPRTDRTLTQFQDGESVLLPHFHSSFRVSRTPRNSRGGTGSSRPPPSTVNSQPSTTESFIIVALRFLSSIPSRPPEYQDTHHKSSWLIPLHRLPQITRKPSRCMTSAGTAASPSNPSVTSSVPADRIPRSPRSETWRKTWVVTVRAALPLNTINAD